MIRCSAFATAEPVPPRPVVQRARSEAVERSAPPRGTPVSLNHEEMRVPPGPAPATMWGSGRVVDRTVRPPSPEALLEESSQPGPRR